MNNSEGYIWDKKLTAKEFFDILKDKLHLKITIEGVCLQDKYGNNLKRVSLPLNAAAIEFENENIQIDINELIYQYDKELEYDANNPSMYGI